MFRWYKNKTSEKVVFDNQILLHITFNHYSFDKKHLTPNKWAPLVEVFYSRANRTFQTILEVTETKVLGHR